MRFLTLYGAHLRQQVGKIAGWGGALLVLAAYIVILHDAFMESQEQFTGMLSAYPPELMAAFGGSANLFEPAGFLNFTYFSYAAVLLGFLAISLGAGLLSADEERGRLELVAACPVSRMGLFLARLLAAASAMAVILLLSWLAFVFTVPGTGLKSLSALDLALPHVELLAFMLFFGGLALLLSQVLPSRAAAAGVASAYLLASYVLYVLLQMDDSLEALKPLSPLHAIKGGYAVDGLDGAKVAALAALAVAFIALAAWRFEVRDLRVSGEGSWPAWLARRAR